MRRRSSQRRRPIASAAVPQRLLISGGAGFVGSNLAMSLAERHPDWEIVALDNLYRQGSRLNLPRLAEAGVEFVEGDVREPGISPRSRGSTP